MPAAKPENAKTRVIVVAPYGRDAHLICELMDRIGVPATHCPDCTAALVEAVNEVGAFILAEEVLTPETMQMLASFIACQPAWSDLPVIVLAGGGQTTAISEARRKLRDPLGNVILIERPVRPETLASAVKSAIRARLRQYEVRAHLAQEKAAADALRKSEKLAVAGRLAATIAHEINNPLEAIVNLHYLIGSTQSLDDAKRYLALADAELQRVIEITTHTLKFHREQSTASPVDVAGVVDSVLKLYEGKLRANGVKLDRRLEPGSQVVGFGGELRQVAANLISNALDAMPNGGTLRIRVHPASQHSNGAHRGVRMVIADNGSGIPSAVRGKILEPFVSTKEETGTGLGLWVSSEIIRKHHGELRFKSKVGSGTVFSLFLPAQP